MRITQTDNLLIRPIVIYDGTCGLCAGNLKWLSRLDWLKKFAALPYQDQRVYEMYPALVPEKCAEAMHVVFPGGPIYVGVDAVRQIFLRLPLTGILGLLLFVPPFSILLRKIYPIITRNRYRLGGQCPLK